MKRTQITVTELCTAGGITKQAVYKVIRSGKLTFKDGGADVLKLLAEWEAKRDHARADRLGPVLRKIIESRGLEIPAAVKPKPPSAGKEPAAVDASGSPVSLVGRDAEILAACGLGIRTRKRCPADSAHGM